MTRWLGCKRQQTAYAVLSAGYEEEPFVGAPLWELGVGVFSQSVSVGLRAETA